MGCIPSKYLVSTDTVVVAVAATTTATAKTAVETGSFAKVRASHKPPETRLDPMPHVVHHNSTGNGNQDAVQSPSPPAVTAQSLDIRDTVHSPGPLTHRIPLPPRPKTPRDGKPTGTKRRHGSLEWLI